MQGGGGRFREIWGNCGGVDVRLGCMALVVTISRWKGEWGRGREGVMDCCLGAMGRDI